MSWYLKVLQNYAVFDGRARRKEYWFFALFNMLFATAFTFIDKLIGTYYSQMGGYGILNTIYSLAVLIPGLAVSVRRLHDTNRSGWWLLLYFIPIIGWIWILILMVRDSDSGMNNYGPNPKKEI